MRLGLVILTGFKLHCRYCVQNRLINVHTSKLTLLHSHSLCCNLHKYVPSLWKEVIFRLPYSTNSNNVTSSKKKEGIENDKPEQTKKKKEIKVFISLIGSDGKFISVTTVEEATKLAARRNMRLVKVIDYDPKTARAVYKLITASDYLKEDDCGDSKSREEKSLKGEKVVSLSSTTAEHDVLTKVKMMQKWLEKRFEVRVVITGESKSGENVFTIIEREIGNNGRIVQKRRKGQDIRFQILPPKKTEIPKKIEPLKEVEKTGTD